jgi:hypothetical protein
MCHVLLPTVLFVGFEPENPWFATTTSLPLHWFITGEPRSGSYNGVKATNNVPCLVDGIAPAIEELIQLIEHK